MATVRQTIPADSPSVTPAFADSSPSPEPENRPPVAPSAAPVPARSISTAEVEARFEAFLRQVRANRPNEDVSLIRKAWDFCVQHHSGQKRASGEPYIIHPLEVAEVLAEMKLDGGDSAVLASVGEFLLEGLYVSNRLSKYNSKGKTFFRK